MKKSIVLYFGMFTFYFTLPKIVFTWELLRKASLLGLKAKPFEKASLLDPKVKPFV